MSRYIDADAIQYRKVCKEEIDGNMRVEYMALRDQIDDIPTAELVIPVKQITDAIADKYGEIAMTTSDVRDDATAHKVVGGGERDGATCWFECDNCGLAVDIGDVFCKHCGARFVP